MPFLLNGKGGKNMEQYNQRKMMFTIRQNAVMEEQQMRDALSRVEGIIVSPYLGSRVVFERDEHGIKGPRIYPEIRGICSFEDSIKIYNALLENGISYIVFRMFDPTIVDPDSVQPMDDEDYRKNVRRQLENPDHDEYLDELEE